MISNPCTWFATSGNREGQRGFTYEGGSHLYHFDCSGPRDDVRTGWTDNWVPVNVVFFANSPEHAKDVFRRMLEFRIETLIQYIEHNSNISRPSAEEFAASAERWYTRCKEWLAKIDEAVFTLAPTDQFFKVAWACNDLILN